MTQGDLLFLIDPDPYQAMVDQAEGQLKLYRRRSNSPNSTTPRTGKRASSAVSTFQLNQDKANVEQADARIKSAEAALKPPN